MNVGPVLVEIGARAEAWRPGTAPHVLNFTLFPMTEADTAVLQETLGQAPLTIVSGGFGTCRIAATWVRRVWAVKYLDAMGKPIVDTLEIGDVPEVACAAAADFAASVTRLARMSETYRS
jgi:hydrogenase-1 operon protein HyaF